MNNECGLWFGTEQKMVWFPTPLTGAESSPSGWQEDGTLLNGGGYSFSSFGSHKRYVYEWPNSSTRQEAQLLKSYADGSFGRGLIYFHDPLTYDTNVLPARLADPSMAVGYEGASLAYGVEPTAAPAVSGPNNFPVYSTNYALSNFPVGFNKNYGAVFIPVPDGYTLLLGASYASTGTGGVYVSRQNSSGVITSTVKLTEVDANGTVLLPDEFAGDAGVWVWVGRTTSVASSVSLRGIIGRLIETSKVGGSEYTILRTDAWVGGQGHSGCRFLGKPTYVEYNGVNGGQVGFAASFVEVGSWSQG